MIIDTSKKRGIIRKMYSVGRLSLAKEYCNALNIVSGNVLELYLLEDGKILIVPQKKTDSKT
ncbi:MAG: hypothetical protein LBJ12_03310 [Oscillospiraceae bacterium]|nr:hypothetical protein [Oscillospiraceae bacterium]